MQSRRIRSVLYVDDDPDICAIVRASLSLISGIEVLTASGGEEAIDVAFERRPDLILMDVMMPGLDGPSTLKRIRNSALISSIPVIFLTAKVLPAELSRYKELGALGVISKPFDPLRLGEQLQELWAGTLAQEPPAPSPAQESPVRSQVEELSGYFIARTRSDVPRLHEMIEQLERGSHAVLAKMELLAHSIHGAGAMFGFRELSQAAGAIESLAARIASATVPDAPPSSALLEELRVAVDSLAAALEAASGAAPPGAATPGAAPPGAH